AKERAVREAGQVFDGAREHTGKYRVIDFRASLPILAGRTDQQLPGGARLPVERNGFGRRTVRALQVAQLDKLVTHQAGASICYREVAFAWRHGEPGQQTERSVACGKHQQRSCEVFATFEADALIR